MMLGYKVKTSLMEDGNLLQEVDHVVNGMATNMLRQIVMLQDQQIHAALVAMGWTPPAAVSHSQNQSSTQSQTGPRVMIWCLPLKTSP